MQMVGGMVVIWWVGWWVEVNDMAKFKDNTGREWTVEISVATTMRLRAEGLNFYEMRDNGYKKLIDVLMDDVDLSKWLYAILKPEAEKAGVDAEAFYVALGGDALNAACNALKESVLFFIRNAETRSDLQRAFDNLKRVEDFRARKTREAMDMLMEMGMEEMEKEANSSLSKEALRAKVDAAIKQMRKAQQTSSESSGVSQAS